MSEYYINGVLYRHDPPDKLTPIDNNRKPCPNCHASATFDARWCGFLCLSVPNCGWTQAVKKFDNHEHLFEIHRLTAENERMRKAIVSFNARADAVMVKGGLPEDVYWENLIASVASEKEKVRVVLSGNPPHELDEPGEQTQEPPK